MAIISRQTGLLAAENWKKVYQTFREADFTSYDFETLRKSMLDYLKLYYPEDFNDFTESSEFIALIDLIAFFGQSLAFRLDMNARENFLDTAERRDSILKLARLISYNPKRAISASGFLKVDNFSTTENVYDSNGLNLSNKNISWDDPSNDNWLEQVTVIVNASLVNSQVIGRPGNSQVINSIKTDEYSININPMVVPVYKFETSVEGARLPFEIVSATSLGQSYIYENIPSNSGVFNVLLKNDNSGNASNNTGFFFYFKQGSLATTDFVITESFPNKVVSIDIDNINNSDVWLYKLDSNGNPSELWQSVATTSGVNVIYNNSAARNLYQINSRAGDQIDLVFGDGAFSNIPQGNFRLFYRTNNGLGYKITADEMRSIAISFDYVSRANRVETITFRASLKYTVANAAARESTDDIKQKAPQQYYTQNRMITGEDYNILPYTTFSTVAKVKAINRTSAGLSRYLDMLDTTGKYSSTNMFGQDGVLYRNNYIKTFKFSFLTIPDIRSVVNASIINDIISAKELLHFYYASFPAVAAPATINSWHLSSIGDNSSTGYFINNAASTTSKAASINSLSTTSVKYFRSGAVVKFTAPSGHYFNATDTLVTGSPVTANDKMYIYATIVEVYGDGTNNNVGSFSNGTGPVRLSIKVPTGAIVDSIIPVFKNALTVAFTNSVVTLISGYKDFGLSFNTNSQTWRIVYPENMNTTGVFSTANQGNQSGTNLDASWLLRFSYSSGSDEYTVSYRGIEYVFHSPSETNFYFDETVKIYDSKTATVIRDQVKVLRTNAAPDSSSPLGQDLAWYVYKNITGTDGYTSNRSIYLTYADTNNDGVPDNPKLFELLVGNTVGSNYVFFKSVTGYGRFIDLVQVDNNLVIVTAHTPSWIQTNIATYDVGQLFYLTATESFRQITGTNASKTLSQPLTDYIVYAGRQDILYQYRHNAPNDRRIDPSTSNLIDLYVLTSAYDTEYRQWIQDTSNTIAKPDVPTSIELAVQFAELNNVKAISDSIVYQNAVFKPIFGSKANSKLQATFKVVKNPTLNISDADIKTSVISAINTYFSIANWDFGDDFYFSELSAYLHQTLSPNIASIVIVPKDVTVSFGSLYQINADPTEIIISAATVNDVEIITAVTAGQLNQSLASSNRSITF